MNHSLNSSELECLLQLQLKNKPVDNETLQLLFNNASQWQDKLICLTFSFARILERQHESTLSGKSMISEMYSMPDKMFFEIQECDDDFVDYMLRHEHSGINDLEMSLLEVAKKMSRHCYGKNTLRN